MMLRKILFLFFFLSACCAKSQQAGTVLGFMELNTENMFDCQHDSLKNDYEFLPDAPRHWNRTKYSHKVNRIGQ